jgi:purine-nucleoside phosphorylase
MVIKGRLLGNLYGAVSRSRDRAVNVARAELGTAAVAPIVFLPVTRQMSARLANAFRRPKRRGDTLYGSVAGRDVSVVNTGVGAPSAEGKVLACLGMGAEVLLRVDICGGLEPDMKVGDVVVATRAVPFDNTTRLLTGEAEVPASPLLVESAERILGHRARCRYHAVAVATVDTFHHQTDEMHRRWRRRAAAVDMETSVIYELSRRAGAHALGVMAVSDVRAAGLDPFGEGYFPYGDLYCGLDDVAEIAVDLVKDLPDSLPPLREEAGDGVT